MYRFRAILLAMFLIPLFAVSGLAADLGTPGSGALNTAMTEPQYQSYLGQALMWKGKLVLTAEEKKYHPAFYATGVMNRNFLVLFRFQPDNFGTLNLYGRHMTILFDSRSDLVGMVRTKPEWADMKRIDDKTAVERAAAFVWNFTPDLFRYVESPDILDYWIESQKNGGERVSIPGAMVRYKDPKRNTCFFVIVAPDKTVMAFERNIVWDAQTKQRQSESFLYDAWLEKHGYRGQ